jgi:putative nucleotidyltransferase with HDIG domain
MVDDSKNDNRSFEDTLIMTFPQIKRIKDESLRKKVINVWLRAINLAKIDVLEDIPFYEEGGNAVKEIEGQTLVDHINVVTDLATELACILKEKREYNINIDYVIAGGLLHDVGKVLLNIGDRSYIRHTMTGTWLALEEELPKEVSHIIAVHSSEGENVRRTIEAICVYHADWTDWETIKEKRGEPGVKRIFLR